MGLFDDFFGDMFDLDGDGKTDEFEELVGLDVLEFFEDERKTQTDSGDDDEDEDDEYVEYDENYYEDSEDSDDYDDYD